MIHPKPGDVLNTHGAGLLGVLIRTGTQASIAHNGIWIEPVGRCRIDGCDGIVWITHEAFGSKGVTGHTGINPRYRCTGCDEYIECITIARNPAEQYAILKRSHELVEECTSYDFVQVGRIGIHVLVRLMKALHIVGLWRPLAAFRNWVSRFSKSTHYFCTEHVALCLLEARPEMETLMPYPPNEIFPEALAEVCRTQHREDDEAKSQQNSCSLIGCC